RRPAPVSTSASNPDLTSRPTESGMRPTRFSPSAISFGIPIFMYQLHILQSCVSTQRKGGLAAATPPSHVYHIRFSVTVTVCTPRIMDECQNPFRNASLEATLCGIRDRFRLQ